ELEKLLGRKIEVEPIEFEEERARGRHNDGRRRWQADETGDARDQARRERRPAERRPAPVSAPADPFFDRPYEAPSEPPEQPPAWEQKARPSRPGLSANIKPKRKLAALFKAPEPTH
ncbi:MAG TPA: ATP-dependent helicase, partial [Ottowia sp.]|nr:ATP-dependent helicase [Ottowia sp.]